MIIEPEGWKRPSLIHPQLSSLLLTDSLLNYIKHLVWGCPLFPATFPSAPRCWDVFSTFHCNNLSFMLVFNLVDKEDKLFLESSQQLCTKLQIVLKSWLWKKKIISICCWRFHQMDEFHCLLMTSLSCILSQIFPFSVCCILLKVNALFTYASANAFCKAIFLSLSLPADDSV